MIRSASEPRLLGVPRSAAIAIARAANALFFLLTATYCLLSYSSFAYQQFIRPHLLVWLTDFVIWHHLWFWAMLAITAVTIISEPIRTPGRTLAWSYLAVSAAIGVVLLKRSVLPQVENNGFGLVLALVALVPPLWLALIDHRATSGTFAPDRSSERRVMQACLVACVVIWVEQTALVPWRLDRSGEVGLTRSGILFGVTSSAVAHLVVFAAFSLALLFTLRIGRAFRQGGRCEYWLVASLSIVAMGLAIDRFVFRAIAFSGPAAWTLSVALAVALTLTWSGIARRRSVERSGTGRTAIDVWLSPLPGLMSRRASVVTLIGLTAVSLVLIDYVATFDWDFLVQRLCIVGLWWLAFAYAFGAARDAPTGSAWRLLAWPSAAFIVFAAFTVAELQFAVWTRDQRFVPEFVREGYVAVDPSFRLIRDLLRVDSPEDAAFYAHLRASTMIQHVALAPVDIDFVRPLAAAKDPGPNIFLFVIDSLRRDYLSPYNAAVQFTPAIGAFAADSVVFERAFTRYGGTGLSVPSIWAGGMLIHKQYVTPFNPMNTLLKLLDAEGYRRFMSMDSIVTQLLPRDSKLVELDRDVPVTSYRLCRTLDELTERVASESAGSRPLFAYSLPQDIHLSHILGEPVPPGASYPGFVPQVAAQVERMDACFGRFIQFLRESGLYDNSVIVLTSDHGDSLGEWLRWGHSSTMFSEVMSIPLIMHVPERLRQHLRSDPTAVSFSTDITPTLYTLIGHSPANLGPLFGASLFKFADDDFATRRTEPYLAVSSYGAVYAVLRNNGSKLYIADAVNRRDYAYDLHDRVPVRVGVPAADRALNQRFIREGVDELARLYRFTPSR